MSTHKHDQYSNVNIWASNSQKIYSFKQLKVYGLYFCPWKFKCPILLALGAAALRKWSPLGRAWVNCLESWLISCKCWKHFKGLSLDLGPKEHIIWMKVYWNQEIPEYLSHSLFSRFCTVHIHIKPLLNKFYFRSLKVMKKNNCSTLKVTVEISKWTRPRQSVPNSWW